MGKGLATKKKDFFKLYKIQQKCCHQARGEGGKANSGQATIKISFFAESLYRINLKQIDEYYIFQI